MAKSLSASKAKAHLRVGRILVLTYGAQKQFSIDGVGPISTRLAQQLTMECEGIAPTQGDLFLQSNDDGLFPGFPQTWSAK